MRTSFGKNFKWSINTGSLSCTLETNTVHQGFPYVSAGKESACNGETWVQSLGLEDPLEKGKATHSNILAWRTPRTKSVGLQSVGHDRATFTLTQSTAPPPYRPDYDRK